MPTFESTLASPELRVGGRPPVSTSAPARVSIRQSWFAPWVLKEDIIPQRVAWSDGSSGPGEGLFLYRYGELLDRKILPADWSRWFIKLEFDGNVWVGQITTQATRILGDSKVLNTPAGTMVISALSLESLFYYDFVFSSRYIDFTTLLNTSLIAREGFTFNDGGKPNMAKVVLGQRRDFGRKENAVLWSTRDIILYALQNYVPFQQNGNNVAISISIDQADLEKLPDWDSPIVPQHGYRPIEIINRLVSRQRMLMWWLELDEHTSAKMKFRVANLNLNPLPDGSGNTIPANQFLFRINADKDASTEMVVEDDTNSVVDQVIVQGAKRRNCLTVAFKETGTLHVGKAKWSEDLEEDYETGGSELAGYPDIEKRGDRRSWHAAYRARPKFRDVFSRFGLDLSSPLPIPVFNLAVHFDQERYKMAPFNLHLLATLPLIDNRDYSGLNILRGLVQFDLGPDDAEMHPIILFQSDEGYIDAARIGRTDDVPAFRAEGSYGFSCNIQVVPDDPSFRLEVVGDQQHVLAANSEGGLFEDPHGVFNPQPADKNINNIDWRDMLATIAFDDDRRCEAAVPATNQITGSAPKRTIRINAGDQHRLDWVAPVTVVDVDTGTGEPIYSEGGFIRDDRKKLESIARRAYAYYSTTRRILRMSCDYQFVRTLDEQGDQVSTSPFELGRFILDVRNGHILETDPPSEVDVYRKVNTVVSQVTMTFPVVESDRPITQVGRPRIAITTAFGQVSPEFFIDNPSPPTELAN